MILGGIAANSGFSAREIESFDIERARFWWNALCAYHQRVKDISDEQ